jgi:SAM-dependent methyltransferase
MLASAAGESLATSGLKNEPAIDTARLDVMLQCPRCRVDIQGSDCAQCALHLQLHDGIVYALPPERVAHYARFTEEYERIRAAEGRGSDSDDFYLGLPYSDVSGKNGQQWKIRARSYDYLIKHVLRPNLRAGSGRILDLGAGNCWMSFRLASAGYRLCAVDLLINERDGLGAGTHYRKYLPEMFPRLQAELARLPFQNGQFDAVVFNASFHYAEDYEGTLGEALRCVKTGGMVVISDTPWYSREESGRRMVSERRAAFLQRYGTASDSVRSLDYLTDERLRILEGKLLIRWTIHCPRYGFKWAMRPLAAKLRNRREPSQFRIYVVRKESA